MRILFALPGLHRIDRGAEIAFTSVATALAKRGHEVVLAGSGQERNGTSYRFVHVPSLSRQYFERFPIMPVLRDITTYEELTFAPGLLWRFRPSKFDVTVTCSYPFTNWVLRRPAMGGIRPPHVFVTENGDWPARSNDAEYRFFGCEGLVCINPDFHKMNRNKWFSALIPNGVDTEKFKAGKPDRKQFGLPEDRKIVLMVSALIGSKRVDAAIEALSRVPDAHLAVAGTGPMRAMILAKAQQLLSGRFTSLNLAPAQMPDLYSSVDVLLHMSLEESFGNVFIEAMASGLPIIAHTSSRLRWIVGENALLLDTLNLADVANSIAQFMLPTDRGRANLRQAAAKFDWSRIAVNYEIFFGQVIDRWKNSKRGTAGTKSNSRSTD